MRPLSAGSIAVAELALDTSIWNTPSLNTIGPRSSGGGNSSSSAESSWIALAKVSLGFCFAGLKKPRAFVSLMAGEQYRTAPSENVSNGVSYLDLMTMGNRIS